VYYCVNALDRSEQNCVILVTILNFFNNILSNFYDAIKAILGVLLFLTFRILHVISNFHSAFILKVTIYLLIKVEIICPRK